MNEAQCEPRAVQNMAHIGMAGLDRKEEGMTLKTHKRLTDLAYRVKDFIDGNGGLNYQESCIFGQIITGIINLK